MSDPLIVTPVDPSAPWKLDVDIVDGWFREVPEPQARCQTLQRAGLAAYQVKNTIPALPDIGANWGAYSSSTETLVEIDNEIKQNIQSAAGAVGNSPIIPSYVPNKNGSLDLKIIAMESDADLFQGV